MFTDFLSEITMRKSYSLFFLLDASRLPWIWFAFGSWIEFTVSRNDLLENKSRGIVGPRVKDTSEIILFSSGKNAALV